jgi:hypothetical protein
MPSKDLKIGDLIEDPVDNQYNDTIGILIRKRVIALSSEHPHSVADNIVYGCGSNRIAGGWQYNKERKIHTVELSILVKMDNKIGLWKPCFSEDCGANYFKKIV